jgi:beta-1,4-mannosyltransferase
LYLSYFPSVFARLPFVLLAPIKIIHQVSVILHTLLFRIPDAPEFIVVQVRVYARVPIAFAYNCARKNPPSIPTLALVRLVGWLRQSRVIIDWHNLGYTILALRLGQDHVLVQVAER